MGVGHEKRRGNSLSVFVYFREIYLALMLTTVLKAELAVLRTLLMAFTL